MHHPTTIISPIDSHKYTVPTLLDEKNPGVFQSNFRIFQVLSVIVCQKTSNIISNSYQK